MEIDLGCAAECWGLIGMMCDAFEPSLLEPLSTINGFDVYDGRSVYRSDRCLKIFEEDNANLGEICVLYSHGPSVQLYHSTQDSSDSR